MGDNNANAKENGLTAFLRRRGHGWRIGRLPAEMSWWRVAGLRTGTTRARITARAGGSQ